MERLSAQIIEKALSLPEGAPIAAKALLHLGSSAAIDHALSRLRRRGQLLRAGRGLYVRLSAADLARARRQSKHWLRQWQREAVKQLCQVARHRRTSLV